MQIKTTVRFDLTRVKRAIVKKTNNKCWEGRRADKEHLLTADCGAYSSGQHGNQPIEISQNLKIELYDLVISSHDSSRCIPEGAKVSVTEMLLACLHLLWHCWQ